MRANWYLEYNLSGGSMDYLIVAVLSVPIIISLIGFAMSLLVFR